MDIRRFIREYRPLWSELEELLAIFESSRKRGAKAAQIDRLTRLYKTVSGHLAYAQTYYPNDEIAEHLNRLVSRTHHALHSEQWKSSNRLGHFFKYEFACYLRDRRWAILIAALLFGLGALGGYLSVRADPVNLYAIVPANIANNVDPELIGVGHDELAHASFSSSIMANNIKVAVLAFASGITFGLMTVYVLVHNGILIGALAAVFAGAGRSYIFWAYILPHGIIELTAIFIAGGAGLYMGYRMIHPGPYTRKYAFLQSVKQSALLLIGTLPLFVAAGIIEGYVTPSAWPPEAKYAFAGLTLLALALYVAYGLRYAARLGGGRSVGGIGGATRPLSISKSSNG
jgi:Uncharacterized membrane protein